MKGIVIKAGLVFGLIMMLLSTNITAGLLGRTSDSVQQKSVDEPFIKTTEKTSLFSLNVFGKTNQKKHDVALSTDDATLIFDTLKELKSEMAEHPYSQKTQSLKIAFVDLLDEKGVIPNGTSKEAYLSMLNPRWVERLPRTENTLLLPQPFANRGTSVLCSVGGEGTGLLIPLFLLPRPRIAMLWLGNGLTTAANLITSKGYIAGGAQTGFTFGFMGIGISYSLPGYSFYGFIGYALLASTTAEYVEHYPPNRAPTISDVLPADGGQNIPLSLTELQFRIQDADGDLMSYTVTTDPNIGSASGNLKPFGVYTVPVSGLVDLTKYTWHIQVTDGKDTTDQILTFTAEAIAPIISNPMPADGERDVPMDLSQLQFTLKDYQGDTMEYTVQTSPNIGSDHKVGVHDGTYTVPVSGLMYGAAYRWFVNATDGTHWTRKVFSFETGYPSQFDPFEFGWQYRKQITIDHTKIAGDLSDFTILLSRIDADLHLKAQEDGGDILFMNGLGVALKLYHEIETYNTSSGQLIAWIKIPFLSSNNDTVLYMYYGNPTCANTQYPQKTWDSNYKMVQHMNGGAYTTIDDSTSNDNDVTAAGGTPDYLQTGKIGFGTNFAKASSESLTIPRSTSLEPANYITVGGWFKFTTVGTERLLTKGIIYGNGYAGYSFIAKATGLYLQLKTTTQLYEVANTGVYALPTGTWTYVTATYDGSNIKFFVNGTQLGNNIAATGTIIHDTGATLLIGTHSTGVQYLDAVADELHISNSARSMSWISTEYNNQNDPSAFLNVGPEEPGP